MTTWHSLAGRRRPFALLIALVIGALLMAGLVAVGYQAGAHSEEQSHSLVGRAYIGVGQAAVRVADFSYNIPVSDGSLPWYDSHGVGHDGGIAPCLRHPTSFAWLRFGYATADGPDGTSWRQVVWVRCIERP